MAENRRSHTLSHVQQIFVSEYIANQGNGTAAYRAAFPNTAASPKDIASRASRLLKLPKVQAVVSRAVSASHAAVERVVAKHEITVERVAEELACLAFTRLQQVADVVHETDQHGKQRLAVHVKPFAECDQDALAAIVEVKRTAGGEVSVKLADKRAALMDIARLKGWIADKPVDNKQLVMLKIER